MLWIKIIQGYYVCCSSKYDSWWAREVEEMVVSIVGSQAFIYTLSQRGMQKRSEKRRTKREL